MNTQYERKRSWGHLQKVYMQDRMSTDNTLMSHELCSCGKSHLVGEGQDIDELFTPHLSLSVYACVVCVSSCHPFFTNDTMQISRVTI